MGIRISTGIGPLRVSVPLTGRRRRRRRTRRRARAVYYHPAAVARAAAPRIPARHDPARQHVSLIVVGALAVLGGLGDITKPAGVAGLLVGVGLVAYGVHRAKAAKVFRAERERIRTAQSYEIQRYHAMGAREFEQAIAYLCHRDGCTNVQVVGGAGDLGADVIATAPDGRKIVIQCKRYGPTTKVGSGDMQKFGGTCYNVHQAQVAALVTTSTFTKAAAQYGAGMRIGLYDRDMLAGWASRTGPAPWM